MQPGSRPPFGCFETVCKDIRDGGLRQLPPGCRWGAYCSPSDSRSARSRMRPVARLLRTSASRPMKGARTPSKRSSTRPGHASSCRGRRSRAALRTAPARARPQSGTEPPRARARGQCHGSLDSRRRVLSSISHEGPKRASKVRSADCRQSLTGTQPLLLAELPHEL
jgi:hypothetical protein